MCIGNSEFSNTVGLRVLKTIQVKFITILWSNCEGMSGIKGVLELILHSRLMTLPVFTLRDIQCLLYDYSHLHSPTFVSVVLLIDVNVKYESFPFYLEKTVLTVKEKYKEKHGVNAII